MNIKNENIDIILQFIIATAGQEDNKWERELGNIHLIKYLYLADLSYAKHNNGTIFTNLEWRFHHFGPWTVDAYKRIEPALNSIGADKKHYKSKYGDDFIRWSLQDDEIYTELKNKLPCSLASSIESYVHKYNSSTEDLLDYVYKTWPMLKARPEELLDFKLQSFFNAGNHTNCKNTHDKKISNKKQKLKKIALKNLKENIQKNLKIKMKSENSFQDHHVMTMYTIAL